MNHSGLRRRHDRIFANLALALPVGVIALLHGWVGASYIGSTMLALLVLKLIIARRARATGRRMLYTVVPNLRVCAVMPLHNEDPQLAVAGVRSMLAQSRPLARIHVVDDGSDDGGAAVDAVQAVLAAEAGSTQWVVTRLVRNMGKRRALAEGFRAAVDVDIFLCVDSDTTLDPNAVENGLRPFVDPEVSAVAGFVSALNWRRNILTRLIDLRYVSAFLSERAAYSYFGAVLCCCGSLSFYRASVIRSNLDDFVGQQFLGQTATFGDDRRLTNYALRAGRVVLVEDSRAQTAVPERFGHYLRQQVRWNKSFIRESAWVLGTFPVGHGAFWLTLVEVVGWIIVGTLTLAALVLAPLIADLGGLVVFMMVTAFAAYARNAAYLDNSRDGVGIRERIGVFLLAPLYGAIHLFFLLPIRFWALMTLRRTGWGTRRSVEVRLNVA